MHGSVAVEGGHAWSRGSTRLPLTLEAMNRCLLSSAMAAAGGASARLALQSDVLSLALEGDMSIDEGGVLAVLLAV